MSADSAIQREGDRLMVIWMAVASGNLSGEAREAAAVNAAPRRGRLSQSGWAHQGVCWRLNKVAAGASIALNGLIVQCSAVQSVLLLGTTTTRERASTQWSASRILCCIMLWYPCRLILDCRSMLQNPKWKLSSTYTTCSPFL